MAGAEHEGPARAVAGDGPEGARPGLEGAEHDLAPSPAATLLAEARRRYEGGDYAEAEPLARGALRDAAAAREEPVRVAALQLVGECEYSLGRYREAAATAAEVMRLRQTAPPVDRAETRNLEGVILLASGDAPGGLAAVEEALALRESALGYAHPDTLESLNNRGVALARVGRMPEAIATHEEAIRRCLASSADPTRALAVGYNALAVKLDRDPATRDRARELYERAIEAGEAALGPEHPLVATMHANAGTCAVNAGDSVRGRELIEAALQRHERRYGPTHPNTATVLLTASFLAREAGETALALERAERATRIRLDAFGMTDERTRQAVVTMIRAHEADAKARIAAAPPPPPGGPPAVDPALLSDGVALLAVYRDLAGPDAARDSVRFASDPGDGERVLRAYLERAATRTAAPDPAVTAALGRAAAAGLAADTAFLAGDRDAAAVAATRRVEVLEAALGAEALELVEPLRRLAAIERARGDGDAALAVDRRIHAILAAAYGERHVFVLRARAELAMQAARLHGPQAARGDLQALLETLATAEPGGLGEALRDRIERQLAELDRRG